MLRSLQRFFADLFRTMLGVTDTPQSTSDRDTNAVTRCPDEIAPLIAAIIERGILAARASAWGKTPDRCGIEADHIHNLPNLFKNYRAHDLHYYWTIERPIYIRDSDKQQRSEFEPLWRQLKPHIARLTKNAE